MAKSIWGEEFTIEKKKPAEKKILEKINKPKTAKVVSSNTKKLESNKLSLDQRLSLIYAEVMRILGDRKDETILIKDKESLHEYIDRAITNGIIAIDTETNNSLQPVTCKLMGGCIYTPGMKQAYIPVNHVNKETRELLPDQVTEQDIKEEFDRLNEANVKVITQNGKFDYQVLKCTCNYIMPVHWDTLLGTKILDENVKDAGLKQQYIEKIDPNVEHYDISGLFSAGEDANDDEKKKKEIEYAIVDPDMFALYAASDAYMTYKLYEYQWKEFNKPGNEGILNLAMTIEMPLVTVIGDLELAGMEVDLQYAELLSKKYHAILDKIDAELAGEEAKLKPTIAAWRNTPEANFHPKSTKPDKDGNYKLQKSKAEQLGDPIIYSSPTQLAILMYDILKAPVVNKKKPRATGEEELKEIADKLKLPICNKILERRGIYKLLTTYIDSIPELAKQNPDGRVRTHFNAYGAVTGRLSSSKPLNFQNIPSHNKEIRLMFKAAEETYDIFSESDTFEISSFDYVTCLDGSKKAGTVLLGDSLLLENESGDISPYKVVKVENKDSTVKLYIDRNI